MALFYIMDHDAGGASERYRLHDIVDVTDDCNVNLPPAPPFRIIQVSGVTKAQVERFLEAHMDTTDPENPVMVARRKWKLDLSAIPTAWKNAFLADRYAECTLAQARKYVLNKVTNLHDDGS